MVSANHIYRKSSSLQSKFQSYRHGDMTYWITVVMWSRCSGNHMTEQSWSEVLYICIYYESDIFEMPDRVSNFADYIHQPWCLNYSAVLTGLVGYLHCCFVWCNSYLFKTSASAIVHLSNLVFNVHSCHNFIVLVFQCILAYRTILSTPKFSRALYFRAFCRQVSKCENKGRKYCASITVITIMAVYCFFTGPQNAKFKGSKYVSTKKYAIWKGTRKFRGLQ